MPQSISRVRCYIDNAPIEGKSYCIKKILYNGNALNVQETGSYIHRTDMKAMI